MNKTKKCVLFGTSGQAQVMDYILTRDSEYEVVAFCSTSDYITENTIYDKPLVAFENIEETYPPAEYEMHIAVGYNSNNDTRTRFYNEAKAKGYTLLTYISSKTTNYAKSIGDNCFIFEDNTLQPFVTIGNNVILWSGNHIGHHSTIEDNCFLASHIVVSGHCRVGHNTFIGVNATLRDGISIGAYNILGAACLMLKNTEEKQIWVGNKSNFLKNNIV